MKAVLPEYATIVEKLLGFTGWLQGRQQPESAYTVDTLQAEIYQLERSIANTPTRPTRAVRRHSKPLEPVTEQQKLVDLAG